MFVHLLYCIKQKIMLSFLFFFFFVCLQYSFQILIVFIFFGYIFFIYSFHILFFLCLSLLQKHLCNYFMLVLVTFFCYFHTILLILLYHFLNYDDFMHTLVTFCLKVFLVFTFRTRKKKFSYYKQPLLCFKSVFLN